ncbi:MAG: hypothetical protein QM541_01515 [Flavobacterium sp.]|nr:hypothetical protein [Flavobacterium sp.]
MFDKSFPYKLIQKKSIIGQQIVREFIYDFRSSKRRYIVLVEEYNLNVFVPKFFPSLLKDSPNKFNVLVNDFEASRIVRTCLDIMLDLLYQHPNYSFAFVGVNTISKNIIEQKYFTQRFRIYRALMLNFFDTTYWQHFEDFSTSTYILIPFSKENLEQYLKKVLKMFSDIYPDLEVINL